MFPRVFYFWNSIFILNVVQCYNSFPTLYEYFTEGGIKSGLSDSKPYFTLNEKNITLYGGSLHYFRVPRSYWRDRLKKYRAAGLNSVETYVPWNLHEYQDGIFDFGNGGSDFADFLDIVEFIKLAKEEDLFVILRPGPYICAEWEFGGLPSWLLRQKGIRLRTSDPLYISFVDRYFKELLKLLVPLQFSQRGSIIAIQVENEYGTMKHEDTAYLEKLKKILRDNGMTELLFTSDGTKFLKYGTLPGVLATVNFQVGALNELQSLNNYQPDKPLMVMEFWSGWFDHWAELHQTVSPKVIQHELIQILDSGASVNFYMFHGGTNWGFLNGANLKKMTSKAVDNKGYTPDVTTYDYNAPITEAGDYTQKYFQIRNILNKYKTIEVRQTSLPALIKRFVYSPINVVGELSLNHLLKQSRGVIFDELLPMELLPINNNSGLLLSYFAIYINGTRDQTSWFTKTISKGQSYGYTVYKISKTNIPKNSILKIEGRVCDTVLLLINGELKNKLLTSKQDLNGFGFWRSKDSTINLGDVDYENARLELVVENWGRVNFGKLEQLNNQFKGLWQGNVLINDDVLKFDEIVPLEFKKSWIKQLKNWKAPSFSIGPKLYKAILDVADIKDTYVDMRDWTKGIIIVNDFVLARYLKLGPQKSAFLPAPLLKKGKNVLLVFEHFKPAEKVTFVEDLIFEDDFHGWFNFNNVVNHL